MLATSGAAAATTRAFNLTLCTLLAELARKVPASTGLATSLSTVRAATDMIPDVAINLFCGAVRSGGAQLLEAYRSQNAEVVLRYLASQASMLAELPQVWDQLSEPDRRAVWQYLDNLIKLAGVDA
jgi:hypothetical protein